MAGYLAFVLDNVGADYDLIQSADGETWSDFSPQPSFDVTMNGRGLWGNPFGTEIHCNVRGSGGSDGSIGVYSGGSWSYYTLSGLGLQQTYAISGRSADDVLAVTNEGSVWKWNGSTYAVEYTNGTYSFQKVQYFSDGQAIAMAITVPYRVFWRSAGGSWSDVFSNITATGLTIPVDVWGSASDDVYILGRSGTDIRIAHYNGSTWSQVYYDGSPRTSDRGSIGGWTASNIWVGEADTGSIGSNLALRYDGATWDTEAQAPVLAYTDLAYANATCVIGDGDGQAVIAGRFWNASHIWRYNGDNTWTRISALDDAYNWYTISGYDLDQNAPYLTSQTPAPGGSAATPRGPFAFTVTDDESMIPQATVVIDFDGVEIYDGSTWATGWTGSTIAASGYGWAVVLNPSTDLDQALHTIRVQASDSASNDLDQTYAVFIPLADDTDGTAWVINDSGTHELTLSGKLKRERTAATRCRIRLRTRRGEWFADKNLGSRLHTIEHTKNADRKVVQFVTEALQPLIDDGTILGVTVGRVELDAQDGKLGAEVTIEVPGSGMVQLGSVAIGATS